MFHCISLYIIMFDLFTYIWSAGSQSKSAATLAAKFYFILRRLGFSAFLSEERASSS